MEEKNEGRININDLPRVEQELTAEDAGEVKGGTGTTVRDGAQLQLQSTNTYRGTTTVQN